MTIRHPLSTLTRSERRLWIEASGSGAILAGAVIWLIAQPLQTAAAPLGILSFELAGQPFIVRSILASWGTDGIVRAAFCVGLSALFAIASWALFSILCLVASERIRALSRNLTGAGIVLAWAQFFALAAAFGEQVLLLMLINRLGTSAGVRTAVATRYFAEAKYAILLGGGLYTVLCFYYTEILDKLGIALRFKLAARAAKV